MLRSVGSTFRYPVLLLGAGKIGGAIARLLAGCGDYDVRVGDADGRALARLGGLPGVQTLRLDATDPAALAAAIAELLGDPGRRVALGAAGRERIRREFPLRCMIDAYERLFAAVLGHVGAAEP